MKENKLTVKINKPVGEVFEFTINPKNTPTWIEHLEVEETSEYPPKLGTTYRNHGASGEWDEYTVTAFEKDKVFELVSKDGTYHVRYTYTILSENESEMEYYEWVDSGELSNPFAQEIMNKLKNIIENN